MEALIEELVPPIQGIIHLGIYATSNIYTCMIIYCWERNDQ